MRAPDVAAFSGDIPAHYDTGLVPVLMAPFAEDLAARVGARPGERVLELAAGTGVLTQLLARRLGDSVEIAATDLNQAMLDLLVERAPSKSVSASVADACALPYEPASFAWVVCQFGVMFFPDKAASFAEALRVLRPRGTYVFNVWDSLEHNDFARCVNQVLKEMFPNNPPKFYETPFGFWDTDMMTEQLREAGFARVKHENVTKACTGTSVAEFCRGLIDGNPVAMELEALYGSAKEEAKREFCRRFSSLYGDSPFKASMRAIVYTAVKA